MSKRLSQEEAQQRIDINYDDKVELVSVYKGKREPITLKCKVCGYTWETMAGNALYLSKQSNIKYCPNCREQELEQHRCHTVCANCGKEIIRVKSDIDTNKSGYYYCSRECANIHKNKVRADSGEWDLSNNYRRRALEKEQQCHICGWNEDPEMLEVHHINENHNDNDIDNLMVLCSICHRKLTSHKYILTDDNTKITKI